jgi:hypothetical protein
MMALLFVAHRRVIRPRAAWGAWPDDARDFTAIARYAESHAPLGSAGAMDGRTWDDLTMNDVFRLLDRTESLVGRQVLYARLRARSVADHLRAFDAVASRFGVDQAQRKVAQRALRAMRRVDACELEWLTQPASCDRTPWHALCVAIGVLMAAALLAAPFYPVLLLALFVGAVASLVVRASATPQVRAAGHAFSQIGPILTAAAALQRVTSPADGPLTDALSADLPSLKRLHGVARWAARDATGAGAAHFSTGMLQYLNLIFCLDGIAMYFGAPALRAQGAALRRVVHAVGEIDAALSVANYRAGTQGWKRPILQPDGMPAVLRGLRHPLLSGAVPNSITLGPSDGVIITGSNMSGKTTFLRTLGVNAVLAQTIYTCLADWYDAPTFVVRTCIGRADDPATGKSYFAVEVDLVLGLVQASRSSVPQLILFDELFRGTNTVERIAAGEAVLHSLLLPLSDGSPVLHRVIAASHDLELIDLLKGVYRSAHFADALDQVGLSFDYRLRDGVSRTRNAIALLHLRGAPRHLVDRAAARSRSLNAVYAALVDPQWSVEQ